MMETILFVHGTGVRTAAFEATLSLLTKKARDFLPKYRVAGCNWGELFGAKLNGGGVSIPEYTHSGAASAAVEASKLARWSLLAEDPLLEIRITPVTMPLTGPEGPEIWAALVGLVDTSKPRVLIQKWTSNDLWPAFIDDLIADDQWERVVSELNGTTAEYAAPMARAVVAAFFIWLRRAGYTGLTGRQREQLEATLVEALGGDVLGIGSWFLGKLTNYAVERREWLSDVSGPAIGDILRYQSRGEAIRNLIGDQAAKVSASVILAHSLGGIAAVDWLATAARDVRALVTVGSQAPYFYEIDALSSIPWSRGLPDFFPKTWLNFFDPSDLLSYKAQQVFDGRAIDVRVDNGQPFPESHSAYWQNDAEVWQEIRRVLG